MPFAYDIKIDLVGQFKYLMKLKLEKMEISKDVSIDDSCFQYFNLKNRMVEPTPRKVVYSKEFHCPKKYQYSLENISEKITKGIDITPHLSRLIRYLDYHDLMLNDWGIHHLHLGTKISKNTGFVERTGPLLFVKFEKNVAYFIGVFSHNDWADKRIIEIIHENWPELIERYSFKGVPESNYELNNKQRLNLRKRGISTFIPINNEYIYAPIGGGYQSSGHSTKIMLRCMSINNTLKALERSVIENITEYVGVIRKNSNYYGKKFIFLLQIKEDNKVFIYEINSGIEFFLGTLPVY